VIFKIKFVLILQEPRPLKQNLFMTRIFGLLLLIFFQLPATLTAGVDQERKAVTEGIYLKNDLGLTWGVLLDQRMSNLHYEGPGGVINFNRYTFRQSYISEWSLARIGFNSSRPGHRNTVVGNSEAGIRYTHLRLLDSRGRYNLYAGGQVNVFGNIRVAPRLGNSYLFADFVAELRPQADLHFSSRFLWRDWNLGFSLAAALAGYTVRIPEYGVSYELSDDGGVKIQGYEKGLLLPHNYAHLTTGIFLRESFLGKDNPNWFRVGYLWNFYTMAGDHGLNTSNALHQLRVELYFMVRD
jgi:hypothetical protein